MVVKIMVPFCIPIIIRHLVFRVPKGTIILTTTHMLDTWCPKKTDLHPKEGGILETTRRCPLSPKPVVRV